MFNFKKKKKGSFISIESNSDTVSFKIYWGKDNVEQINLLIKILVMLNNGDLKDHIEKAILQHGVSTDDEEVSHQIIQSIKNIDESIAHKMNESRYLNSIMSNNKRNPLISPGEVLNIFKNSIGQ